MRVKSGAFSPILTATGVSAAWAVRRLRKVNTEAMILINFIFMGDNN